MKVPKPSVNMRRANPMAETACVRQILHLACDASWGWLWTNLPRLSGEAETAQWKGGSHAVPKTQ